MNNWLGRILLALVAFLVIRSALYDLHILQSGDSPFGPAAPEKVIVVYTPLLPTPSGSDVFVRWPDGRLVKLNKDGTVEEVRVLKSAK